MEKITAWKNPDIRVLWLPCGHKTKMCDLPRVQLQVVFKNTALVSSAVVEELHSLLGLDVTSFPLHGVEPGTDHTIDINNPFAVLATASLLVMGWRKISVWGRTPVEKLPPTFQDGVDVTTRS